MTLDFIATTGINDIQHTVMISDAMKPGVIMLNVIKSLVLLKDIQYNDTYLQHMA